MAIEIKLRSSKLNFKFKLSTKKEERYNKNL